MTELGPVFEKVASSKWLMDEPSKYRAGVTRSGISPLFAATPKGPDHTNFEVRAVPSSIDGEGRSARRLLSSTSAYASNGVG